MTGYRIPLEKRYYNKADVSDVVTVEGSIDIEGAMSEADALDYWQRLVKNRIQTNDARIWWDWKATGWDDGEIIDAGYVYEDFSFGIPEGRKPERID